MDTKFTKISHDGNISNWDNFFRAGDAWLQSLQVLEDSKNQIGWGVFYVKPWIIAFCLELFVKAIAAHKDNSFNGNDYNHKTTKILEDYEFKIPVFEKIFKNKELIGLIKEYEKTSDTKFGETYVSINGSDQNKIVNTVYELRSEICKRTGLR